MSVIERVPETVVVTQSDVLTRAADLLGEFGWKQRAKSFTWHERRETCLLGAIYRAALDLGVTPVPSYGVYDFAFSFLEGADSFGTAGSAFRWNDELGRTKPQVVARLRRAAKRAEQQ